jgi:Uma2 family endonuclease
MSTQPKTFLTPEQYLEIERKAAYKSEYYQGEMFPMAGGFAMAGAREDHNLVVANAIAGIHQQLRSRPCRVYPSDMRVLTPSTGLYTHPDITAVCGQPLFVDDQRDTLMNPGLVVEVVSPSTEAYDRGRKFEHYQSIESLRDYLLISSDRIHTDLFTRDSGGRWILTSAHHLDDAILLPSIDCRLALSDLYEKLDLPDQFPSPIATNPAQ